MKKLLLGVILTLISIAGFSQSIFKPIPKDLFSSRMKATSDSVAHGVFIPRFTASATLQEFYVNKETNVLEQKFIMKTGVGISYAHFIPVDGLPYNNYSISALVLFPTSDPEDGITLAAIVSALKFAGISPGIGAGYDWGIKQPVAFFNAVLVF